MSDHEKLIEEARGWLSDERMEYGADISAAGPLLSRLVDAVEQSDRYEQFADDILRDRLGDLDGGDLQEIGLKHGLLVEVEVTEPCGEHCWCEEWDDFPQTCIRRADSHLTREARK